MPASNRSNQVLKNLSYLSLGDFGSRLFGFVTFVYLARILGPAKLGLIGFGASAIALASPFVDFGLGFVGTREVSRNPHLLKPFVKSIFFGRLVIGIVAAGCIVMVATLLTRDHEKSEILLLYGLTLLPAIVSLTWAYQSTGETGWFSAEKITQSILYFAGIVLLVHHSDEFGIVPVVYTASALLPTLMILVYFLRNRPDPGEKFSVRRGISLLRTSMGLSIPNALSQLSLSIGLLLVVQFGSLEDAGYFSATSKIIVLSAVVPNLLWSSFYPVLARKSAEIRDINFYGSSLYKYSVLIGILPVFFGLTFSHELVGVLFGKSYEGSLVPFQLFCAVASIQSISIVFTRILPALSKDKVFSRLITWGAAVQILVCIALVPRFGVTGAVLSYVISEGAIAFFSLRGFHKATEIHLAKIPLIAISSLVVCYGLVRGLELLVPITTIASILLILILYFGFLWISGIVTAHDFISGNVEVA